MATILDLPVEMLQAIFRALYSILGLRCAAYSGRRETFHSISGVCRLWHTIMLETRDFWTDLDLRYPRLLTKFLERSGGAPLHVVFSPALVCLDRELSQDMYQYVIGPHSSRIASFHVVTRGEKNTRTMARCLERWPPTSLQSLHFEAGITSGDVIVLDPWSLRNISPQFVRLRQVVIPLTTPAPIFGPQLRELSLSVLATSRYVPTLQQVLDLFRRCPLLECFDLHDAGPIMSDLESHETVYAPSLKQLTLRGIFYPVARQLFSRLFTSAHVDIQAKFEGTPSPLFPLDHPIAKRITESPDNSITFSDKNFRVEYNQDRIELTFERPVADQAYFNLFLGSLPWSPCRKFEFNFVDKNLRPSTTDDWTLLLRALPNLDHLKVLLGSDSRQSQTRLTPLADALCQSANAIHTLEIVNLAYHDIDACEAASSLYQMKKQGRQLPELILVPRLNDWRQVKEQCEHEIQDFLNPFAKSVQVTCRY